MPLQATLDAMRTSFESKLPPEIANTMHQATEELAQSGILDRVLKVGERAPQFSLPDHKDDVIASAELLSRGPLVINFYRGAW